MSRVVYDEEFKAKALTMMETQSVSRVASTMKVYRNTLTNWRKQAQKQAAQQDSQQPSEGSNDAVSSENQVSKKPSLNMRKIDNQVRISKLAKKLAEILVDDDVDLMAELQKLNAENIRLLHENAKLKSVIKKLTS